MRTANKKKAPWGLTELEFADVAAVDGSFDQHRLWFGIRLKSGETFYVHAIHRQDGFTVHLLHDNALMLDAVDPSGAIRGNEVRRASKA